MTRPRTPEQAERVRAQDRERAARNYRKANPGAAPYRPLVPRGPSTDPYIPEGHELGGVSTLTDADGKTTAQWAKTRVAGAEPEPLPEGFAPTRVARMTRGDGSVVTEWTTYDRDKAAQSAAFLEACEYVAERYAGLASPVEPPKFVDRDWLSVYPIGDPHVGMLAHASESGDHHDLKIGISDLEHGIDLAVHAAPPSSVGYLLNLGDFFHAQDDRQATPGHGHKLDVDGRWNKVVRGGLGLLVYGVRRLLAKHERVLVGNVPGNHDPDAARMIAIYLEAFFRNEPRVEVLDNASPYHALEFGRNMILTAHGDGAKRDALPGLAATRWPEMWGRTRYRVAYTGHVHHESIKEFPGMTVETFETLAGKDAWHSHRGYDSHRSISVISHHAEFGPKMRSKIHLREVRAIAGVGT